MASEMVRAHVLIPRELMEEVDRLVGPRKRSAFLAEAAAEKVRRERLGRALEETAGFLDPDAYPEWRTPEDVSAWVRRQRALDDASTSRKLRGSSAK